MPLRGAARSGRRQFPGAYEEAEGRLLSEENPFRVLGVSPQLAMSLSPPQLKDLVRDLYRALQRVFHPDRGGSEQESQRINAAMACLEDDVGFSFHYHEFVSNPEPASASRQKELETLRARVKYFERENARLERSNAEALERVRSLEAERERHQDMAMTRIGRRIAKRKKPSHSLDDMEGLEVTCRLPKNTFKDGVVTESLRTLYVVDGQAVKLSDTGTEHKIGTIVGSITPEDLSMLIGQARVLKSYGLRRREELAGILREEISVGNALVYNEKRHGSQYLTILGIITDISNTRLGEAKRDIHDRKVTGELFRKFVTGDYRLVQPSRSFNADAREFNGLITLASKDSQGPATIRNGQIVHFNGDSWVSRGRLVGSTDAKGLRQALGRAEGAVRRKALLDMLISGALDPAVISGRVMIGTKDWEPIVLGAAAGVYQVDFDRVIVKADCMLTLEGSEDTYIICEEGLARLVVSGFREPLGRALACVKPFEGIGMLAVPWFEDRSELVCDHESEGERRYLIDKFHSFVGLKDEEKQALRGKTRRRPRRLR